MYEDTPTIPVIKKPTSSMDVGPNGTNLASAAACRHPVDDLQRRTAAVSGAGGAAAASASSSNPFHNLEHVRRMYGSGLAMRLATEQKLAYEQDCHARAAGLPSSNLYREVVTGSDVELDFKDFLSLPEYRPDVTKENPHKVMEHQLGMM